MTVEIHRKRLLASAIITVTLALLHALWPIHVVGHLAVYVVLAVLPGIGVCLLVDRGTASLELLLASLVIAPVLTGAFATLLILSGMSAGSAATATIVISALIGVAGILFSRQTRAADSIGLRHAVALTATITAFCIAAGYLPLTDVWWRSWADAWFHGAVIAQIDAYGLPPEDPYFAGMALQYMWFYHVLTLTLAKTMRTDPLIVMPLLNIQALVGFALAAFLLSRRMKKGFAYGLFAVIVVMLSLNAGIWLFLPLKLIRSLTGEIQGWEELVRTFTLVPFEKETVTEWVTVSHNQTFLLNKFIVSTAFSLGLFYMSALWYSVVRYLDPPAPGGVVIVFFSVAGLLLFHTLLAFIVIAGFGGALVLLWLLRRQIHGFSARRLLAACLAAAAAVVVTAPYLYSVVHLKDSQQLLPLGLSLGKSIGIIISCALALVLAAFQIKRVVTDRSMRAYVLGLGALSVLVLCNVISLPASNAYDKLPFVVFYPLAVIGSWTLADRYSRRHASTAYRRKVVLVALVLLIPLNLLLAASYYNTSPKREISDVESVVATWVAAETSREALFLDSDDRVFLLVAGPRRYYWGRESYAEQWGYPSDEMSRRKHVRDNVFSTGPLDRATFSAMGSMESDLYIIARDDEPTTGGSTRLATYPGIFHEVFRKSEIAIFEVDRQACLDFIGAARQGEEL